MCVCVWSLYVLLFFQLFSSFDVCQNNKTGKNSLKMKRKRNENLWFSEISVSNRNPGDSELSHLDIDLL